MSSWTRPSSGCASPSPDLRADPRAARAWRAGAALLIDDIELNCDAARALGHARGLVSQHRAGDRGDRGRPGGGGLSRAPLAAAGGHAGRRGDRRADPRGRSRHARAAGATALRDGTPTAEPAAALTRGPRAHGPHRTRPGVGSPCGRASSGFSFEFQAVRAYTGTTRGDQSGPRRS